MPEENFLKSVDLFEGLTEKELVKIESLMRPVSFKEGEFVFHEGDLGKDLYIVQKGEIEILKRETDVKDLYYHLARLKRSDWFGEMALFFPSLRSASAKALQPTEGFAISLEELNALAKKDLSYSQIAYNLAKKMTRRIKNANEQYVESMRKEMRLMRIHDQMGRLLVYLIFLIVFFFYAYKFTSNISQSPLLDVLFSGIVILCLGICVAFLERQSGYPPKFYGLTLENWPKNVLEGILVSIPILIGMVVIKWIFIQTIPQFMGMKLLDFTVFGLPPTSAYGYWFIFVYIVLAPLQEFIARGCLQSCLENFFQRPNRVFLSIVMSNLLFLLFHGLETFSLAAVAFLLGLVWGWLYSRQRSIIGCSISHALCGIWAFGFLNYQNIWIY